MTYAEPKLTARQQQLVQQGMLPFMLRFGGRPMVRAHEIAAETGLSRDLFYDLAELGELEVLRAGTRGTSDKRIVFTTRSVLLWMLTQSNVEAHDWESVLTQWLNLQPRAAKERIAALAQAALAR